MSYPFFTHSRLIRFVSFGLALLGATAWAGAAALEGVVKDAKDRPITGADIRIESTIDGNWNKVVKTDAKGHYISSDLLPGTYRVTLSVNGSVKSSINNTTVKSDNTTQLNFDLKPAVASKNSASDRKGRHMVWMPARTGTHMRGNWVEIDDYGNVAGIAPVDSASSEALRTMQAHQVQPAGTNGIRR